MIQGQNSQRTIYVADDDEDDRMLFLDAMLELNLSVVVEAAVDGLQLLDMIFLDINMPGKNGFECLEEIRSTKGELKDVKIIMLSTSSNPENIELCYELGADLYAVKPSTFEDLKKLLLKVFQMDWYTVKKGNKRILTA